MGTRELERPLPSNSHMLPDGAMSIKPCLKITQIFSTSVITTPSCLCWPQVKRGEFFPADIVFLMSALAEGTCYVETMNLDGETLRCCLLDTCFPENNNNQTRALVAGRWFDGIFFSARTNEPLRP